MTEYGYGILLYMFTSNHTDLNPAILYVQPYAGLPNDVKHLRED